MLYENNRAFLFVGIARLRDKIGLPLTSLEPIMDLNYLYQRYAVSLQMSENAACNSSRIVHRQLAEAYAAQIAQAKVQGSALTS